MGKCKYCGKDCGWFSSYHDDCKRKYALGTCKLKELLIPGNAVEDNLQTVISKVTDIKILSEQSSAHYFIVKMEGVDDISTLLDVEFVKDYISQVAPVPYKERFYWRNEIKKEFSKKNLKKG